MDIPRGKVLWAGSLAVSLGTVIWASSLTTAFRRLLGRIFGGIFGNQSPALNGHIETSGSATPSTVGDLKVLELFAGIGGWRLALNAAIPTNKAVVQAYDSGPHCSETYELNFGEPCSRRNIEQLDVKALDGFDLWVMSPPCQPFSTTREAKQRDLNDKRCKALEHLCHIVPKLSKPPRWIALENVKGFHNSEACLKWRAALQEAGFSCQHFLLDLATFGIPNHRTRYYLLAERSDRFSKIDTMPRVVDVPSTIGEVLPPGVLARGAWARARRQEIEEAHQRARVAASGEEKEEAFQTLRSDFCNQLDKLEELMQLSGKGVAHSRSSCLSEQLRNSSNWKLLPLPREQAEAFLLVFEHGSDGVDAFFSASNHIFASSSDIVWLRSPEDNARNNDYPAHCIGDFLEDLSGTEKEELIVSKEVLQKPFAKGLSYVQPSTTQSFCFTGHYGKVLHKSSGSLLHTPDGNVEDKTEPLNRSDPSEAHGAIRFFSPKEIINMLGFPRDYRLIPTMGLRHRYKIVGNSIAVTVAAELLRVLILRDDDVLARLLRHQRPALGGSEEPLAATCEDNCEDEISS